MNCREIAELTPLYLCGDLEQGRAAEFAAHLGACTECVQTVKREQYYDARLREIVLLDFADAEHVSDRVRERIAAESMSRTPIRQYSVSRTTRRLAAVAMGVAAALALVVFGYRGLLGPNVPRVYAAAVLDHRLEVVEHQPRPWLTDPQEIAQLVQRQGIALSNISVLAPPGFHLDRAKICFLSNEAFLHLVYSNGSQELSVYLRHQSFGQLPALARASSNGGIYDCSLDLGYVASFQKSSLAAMIVSNQSAADARTFAQRAAAAL